MSTIVISNTALKRTRHQNVLYAILLFQNCLIVTHTHLTSSILLFFCCRSASSAMPLILFNIVVAIPLLLLRLFSSCQETIFSESFLCMEIISPDPCGSLTYTSYLSRTPRTYSCKFFLAGVNFTDLTRKIGIFDRFYAKKWRFFTDLTQKIGIF